MNEELIITEKKTFVDIANVVREANGSTSSYPISELASLVKSSIGYKTPQNYGAKGDGITDDTPAFAAAIADVQKLYIPKGKYKITSLSLNQCELEAERGAELLVSGTLSYSGIYYPRIKNLKITACGEGPVLHIDNSYYGVFEGCNFQNPDNKANVCILMEDQTYYQRFEGCTFSNYPTGIKMFGIVNANSIKQCVFYLCGIGIYNDGGENEIIMENTFQSFSVCGVKIDKTSKGAPIRSVILGNYFEGDKNALNTTYVGSIDFSSNEAVKGNYSIANHYTWLKTNTHICNMVSENMIQDFYQGLENVRPNSLMGINALKVCPSNYPSSYSGEQYLGSLMPVEEENGDINLYFYGNTSSGKAWKKIITTGYVANSTINLPPIYTDAIGQGYKGRIQIGYGADENANMTPSARWMTLDASLYLLKIYNDRKKKWDFYQTISSGSTEERPSGYQPAGYQFFDTTLQKPLFSTGNGSWVDANGNVYQS